MKVTVLTEFSTMSGTHGVGEILDARPAKAQGWIRAGLVTKDITPVEESIIEPKLKPRKRK